MTLDQIERDLQSTDPYTAAAAADYLGAHYARRNGAYPVMDSHDEESTVRWTNERSARLWASYKSSILRHAEYDVFLGDAIATYRDGEEVSS